ncbi:MAG TPA: DedA family protein [Anaeromyxobacteraceae bacterium]|nr:DedA family protein [Anaeromyxobacteraceae bacterium]
MVQDLLAHFTYAAILALLVAGGVGIPVPEELVQLTAGYLARRGVLWLPATMAVAWVGLVTGDFLLFRAGRRLGPSILASRHVARVLTPERQALLERHFARRAVLTIVVARHAAGLRLPVFALAGASGVRSATFLLADGLSALASVPLVVGAGWYLAGHVEELRREIRWIEAALAVVAVVAAAGWVALARRRERRAAARQPGATPPARPAAGAPPR